MKLIEKGAKKKMVENMLCKFKKRQKRQSNKYEIETTPCCRLRTIKDEKDQLHPGVLEK